MIFQISNHTIHRPTLFSSLLSAIRSLFTEYLIKSSVSYSMNIIHNWTLLERLLFEKILGLFNEKSDWTHINNMVLMMNWKHKNRSKLVDLMISYFQLLISSLIYSLELNQFQYTNYYLCRCIDGYKKIWSIRTKVLVISKIII